MEELDPVFSEIIGHEFQINLFKRLIKDNRLHTSYLFYGPSGVGKRFFATRIAKVFLGTRKKLLSHPDFIMIKPEKAMITLDQVKEVIDFPIHPPLEGDKKVVIIDEAHKLNMQSANTLLKTLEESPQYMLYLLITFSPDKVLPTIRSRCIHIRFSGLNDEEMEKFLARYNPQISDWLIRLFWGEPGFLLNEKINSYEEMIRAIFKYFTGEEEIFFLYFKNKKLSPDEIELFLEIFYTLLRDTQRIIIGINPGKWKNLAEYEKIIQQKWNQKKIEKMFGILNQLEKELSFNPNFDNFKALLLMENVR